MDTITPKWFEFRPVISNMLMAVLYFCMGKVSIALAVQDESVSSSILQPEGVALAVGLLFGTSKIWPGVLIGQLALSHMQGIAAVPAATSAFGHAVQICVGVNLLHFLGFNNALARQRDYLLLLLVILFVLQPLSRMMGLVALSWFVPVSITDVFHTVAYGWSKQLMGELVTASTLLAVAYELKRPRKLVQWRYLLIAQSLFAVVLLWVFFGETVVQWKLLQIFAAASVALTVMSIRFAMVGATVGSLILVLTTLLALRFGSDPLKQMSDSQDVMLMINTILLGSVFSCGLIGSLICEQGDKERRLTHLAIRDYLTGLYNRRNFYDMAAHEMARMRRDGGRLMLVWMDLDRFKQINDTLGHDIGDRVLVFFARILQESLREEDLIARMGGEEFAILLRSNLEGNVIGEKIRKSIADAQIGVTDTPIFTVSMGITPFLPSDANIDVAIKRADQALYSAKNQGRDCFVIADA